MDVKSIWIPTWYRMDHVEWPLGLFSKPPLGGRPNSIPGDRGIPNAHNRWFILFDHVWGPAWIDIHWNSVWLRARSHMTSHYTWGSVSTLTWFRRCLGTAFGHFLMGSHNFMVTTLGSCVKWPLVFPSPTGYMLWSFAFSSLIWGVFCISL